MNNEREPRHHDEEEHGHKVGENVSQRAASKLDLQSSVAHQLFLDLELRRLQRLDCSVKPKPRDLKSKSTCHQGPILDSRLLKDDEARVEIAEAVAKEAGLAVERKVGMIESASDLDLQDVGHGQADNLGADIVRRQNRVVV